MTTKKPRKGVSPDAPLPLLGLPDAPPDRQHTSQGMSKIARKDRKDAPKL